jgi:metal transporter CNNM
MQAMVLTWIGIALCVAQSAMFSGLNLAALSIPRLRLELEVNAGNRNAQKVVELRRDTNLLLCTIVWGNIATNVVLTLLSESVLTGVGAFVFSTFVITLFGEIFPQAYFSRAMLSGLLLFSPR